MDKLHKSIVFTSLPPSFRDAVRVCQFLDIPYLWIDTLCIVQDDHRESAREICNMGHIYNNAYLNIGAMLSAQRDDDDSKIGLFVDRAAYAHYNDPVCARVSRKDFDELFYISSHVNSIDLNRSALMLRGWVLQERLLSPRSIYFDHELGWECSELLASECYPDGVPCKDVVRPLPYVWGSPSPFRLKSVLLDSRYVAERSNPQRVGHWSSKYESWMRVVEVFSHCNLTYEADRFLSLSGLAKYFMQEFAAEYLTGIWKNDLFHQLLWYGEADPRLPEHKRSNPREYLGK
jgi:hypothetical protein